MGRHKIVSDEELLQVARELFVARGFAASTREIAARAGISESVIYQRYGTKGDLFFSAMVPPALDVDDLLAAEEGGGVQRLEELALKMLEYFRTLLPILLPLATHPSFDFERFAERHPDSPLSRMRSGLVAYLETEKQKGNIAPENPGAAALTLFAALHSLALFERLGVHGGSFDDGLVRAMVRSLWTGLAVRA